VKQILGQITSDSALTQTTFVPKDRTFKMAYATSNVQIARPSLTERFATVISNISAKFALAASEARYMSELSNLNDRELADIGINRADIPAIARDAARS
jgi:uncharacterized protein YjiS (DUF1127 family)